MRKSQSAQVNGSASGRDDIGPDLPQRYECNQLGRAGRIVATRVRLPAWSPEWVSRIGVISPFVPLVDLIG